MRDESWFSGGDEGTERRLILAASTGGHLAELMRIAPHLRASEDSLWVTFDSEQSRSLLQGRRVLTVPEVPQRDVAGVFRTFRTIRSVISRTPGLWDGAVSTGAALALGVLPAAAMCGVPAAYVESMARVGGPSTTGRLLEFVPGVDLFEQGVGWRRPRWRHWDGMLAGLRATDVTDEHEPQRVFVTVGTTTRYRFDALVERVLKTVPAGADIVWQVPYGVGDVPGRCVTQVSMGEFEELVHWSDAVVCHAGVGSVLHLWELGAYPVVVPRRRSRAEHVDDHQVQIAGLIDDLGLGLVREVSDLTWNDLVRASARSVVPA